MGLTVLSSGRGSGTCQSAAESAARSGSGRKTPSPVQFRTEGVASPGASVRRVRGVGSKDNCAAASRQIGGTRAQNDVWKAPPWLPERQGLFSGQDAIQCNRRCDV